MNAITKKQLGSKKAMEAREAVAAVIMLIQAADKAMERLRDVVDAGGLALVPMDRGVAFDIVGLDYNLYSATNIVESYADGLLTDAARGAGDLLDLANKMAAEGVAENYTPEKLKALMERLANERAHLPAALR